MRKTTPTAYAIYKSRDGKDVHAVHVFTQEEHNHRAKAAAKEKLKEMWRHAIFNPHHYRRIELDTPITPFCGTEGFSYDRMTSVNTTERIHFHIAKYQVTKPV